MSTSITFNGVGYTIPAEGDNYGDDLSSYLIAIASGALQKTGGTFTLSSEVNFGATYGLKSVYLKSQATNPASSGIIRLGNTESVSWRNAANNADLSISVNGSDKFTYNSIELADISSVQTLTNKTLTSPAITSPTGLVKADVGLSNVDNTSDATKNSAVATLTNKTIDAASNTISNIANANVSASAAIAYSKLALSNSIVNADINSSAAIAYSKLSLSNSILNADINSSAAIALNKLAATTASRALVTDGSGYVSASAVTATELGYVSGVTLAIQTQLNAKIANSLTTTTGDMIYASGVSTPARLPIGSSGQVLKSVGGIPTWATFSGGINYLSSNPDAEADTTGWSTYSDAAGTSPVDGTGGSPNITWTRTTSTPLRGSASFLFTKDAANRQGQGVSYPFTIDSSDKAKVLQVSFDYMVASGTFAAGDSTTDSDLTVWVYDVTNAVVIQPSTFKLYSNSSTIADKFTANFQSASNSTSFRLIIHNGKISASAYTVLFDNFNVGPQVVSNVNTRGPVGSIIATGSITPPTGYLYADGSAVSRSQYSTLFAAIGTTYGVGDGSTTFNIPNLRGVFLRGAGTQTISGQNYTGTLGASQADQMQGHFHRFTRSGSLALSNSDTGQLSPATTSLAGDGGGITGPTSDGANGTPRTGSQTHPANVSVAYHICFDSGSVQVSETNDARTFSVSLGLTTSQTITSGSAQKVNFDSIWTNTHGTADTTNKRVTAPVSDRYRIHGQLNIDLTTAIYSGEAILRVNGTSVKVQASGKAGTSNVYSSIPFDFKQDLRAGDYVEIWINQGSGSSLSIRSDATAGQLSVLHIERDSSGSNAISASETVACHVAAGSVANATTYNFNIAASIDTHGGWNGSTTYTVQASGIYEISMFANFATTAAAGQYYNVECKLNGSITRYGTYRGDGTAMTSHSFLISPFFVRLRAGDQITFGGNTNFSSVTAAGDPTYFVIKRIGL